MGHPSLKIGIFSGTVGYDVLLPHSSFNLLNCPVTVDNLTHGNAKYVHGLQGPVSYSSSF